VSASWREKKQREKEKLSVLDDDNEPMEGFPTGYIS